MIPTTRQLRTRWFEWPESRFERFNFHREEHLDDLADAIRLDRGPAVVVLRGEPGIGRTYLCEAAAHRARQDGLEVGVWHLDLSGFEPEGEHPLHDYLQHLVEEEEREAQAAKVMAAGAASSAAKALIQADLLGKASEFAAALVSMFCQFEEPLERLVHVLSRSPSHGKTPPRDDPESLRRFLTAISEDRKLVLHVQDSIQLPVTLRRWLIHEAERRPEQLLLVLNRPAGNASEAIVAEARQAPLEFDIESLTEDELRAVLDLRFAPNEFDDDLLSALMRRTEGVPAALANVMADLAQVEGITSMGGAWRLADGGFDDPRVVEVFSAGLYSQLDELLAEESPGLRNAVSDFLSLAALCGTYVPADLPLAKQGLVEEMRDEVIDWLDDVLVEKLGWMWDLGYRHPSFPSLNIYRFCHPLIPRVLLNEISDFEREDLARELLRFLDQGNLGSIKRGGARLLLSIAQHLSPMERAPHERKLAWWVTQDHLDALEEELQRDLDRGRLDLEMLWRIARQSKGWSSFRRLAILEVYTAAAGESQIPFDRLSDLHSLWASLLIEVGRYHEALDQAQIAVGMVESEETIEHAGALNLQALASFYLGAWTEAQAGFEQCLVVFRRILGEQHPYTMMTLDNLASALGRQGKLSEARPLQEQVLELNRRLLGEEHPDTIVARGNLALTLRDQGELLKSRPLGEEVLDQSRRVFGEEHPHTSTAMGNLALTLRDQGELSEARTLFEQALELRRRVLGVRHPQTLITLGNLSSTLRRQDELREARALGQELLQLSRRVLGEEHPVTIYAMGDLGLTLSSQGELREAHLLQDQALDLRRRVFGEDHPETLRAIGTLIQTLRDLKETLAVDELAAELAEKVRRVELPPSHRARVVLRELGLEEEPAD